MHLGEVGFFGECCFLGCGKCEAFHFLGVELWSVRHVAEEVGIFVEVALFGINEFEVVGSHCSLFAGRIFAYYLLVGGDGFGFVAHIMLVDGELQQTLAGFGSGGILVEEL